MKKIIFFFTALLLLSGFMLRAQETVTIGTGTSTHNYPIPGFWQWVRDAAMYTAPEIGMSGQIVSIAYNLSGATNFSGTRAMKIYMMTTPATVVNATLIPNFTALMAQNPQLVKTFTQAQLSFTTGWNTFALDEPFYYNGTDNLLVIVEGRGCTTSGGCTQSAYYSTATGMHWYYGTDGTPADATAAGTFNAQRPNIRLTIEDPSACTRVENLAASNISYFDADITWTPGDAETQWLLSYKSASETVWSNWIETSQPSYSFAALSSATNYTVRVRAFCGAGDTSLRRETSFTTLIS